LIFLHNKRFTSIDRADFENDKDNKRMYSKSNLLRVCTFFNQQNGDINIIYMLPAFQNINRKIAKLFVPEKLFVYLWELKI